MLRHLTLTAGIALGYVGIAANSAFADSSLIQEFRADLDGFEEVPPVSTTGKGRLDAELIVEDDALAYDLSYSRLESAVTQVHIHFGQAGVNGGIMAFLCTNLDNGPDGTQACPRGDSEISGTVTAADVIGPEDQGISAGEFTELIEAMLPRSTYVNVHTDEHPRGRSVGRSAHRHLRSSSRSAVPLGRANGHGRRPHPARARKFPALWLCRKEICGGSNRGRMSGLGRRSVVLRRGSERPRSAIGGLTPPSRATLWRP